MNKSLQAKATPEMRPANLSRSSNSSQASKHSSTPKKVTPTYNQNKTAAVSPGNQSQLNGSVSPALSSQSGGERLPRSKMLKAAAGRKVYA